MRLRRYILLILSGIFIQILTSSANADEILWHGFYSTSAPGYLTKMTWGIAGIAVLVIEAWVFKRYLSYSWRRALIFSFWINLASFLLGGLLSAFIFIYERNLAFFIAPILFFILLLWRRAPFWMYLVTIPTFLIGSLVGGSTSSIVDPMPRKAILLAIEIPLLSGFALSLMIESIIASIIIRKVKLWRVLAIANLWSYVLLIFLFPFFAPNPYMVNDWYLEHIVWRSDSPEKALEFLKLRRADRLFLIGLTSEPQLQKIMMLTSKSLSLNRRYLF